MLKLQIVYPDGAPVIIPAGGAIEADLVEVIVQEVLARGVTFKTRNHVEKDLREGIKLALYKFKENILKVPIRL